MTNIFAPSDSPENWTIEAEGDGFVLIDVWGEYAVARRVFLAWAAAEHFRTEAAKEFYANYEPPDPMRGVEFPFADNH